MEVCPGSAKKEAYERRIFKSFGTRVVIASTRRDCKGSTRLVTKFYKIQSEDRVVNQLQDALVKVLNPVLGSPLLDGVILKGVPLASGANVVATTLGRPLQGWFIVRQRSAGTIFDTQDGNITPSYNLQLTASAAINVDIYVF